MYNKSYPFSFHPEILNLIPMKSNESDPFDSVKMKICQLRKQDLIEDKLSLNFITVELTGERI